jgi:hypothetical protein
MINIQPSSEAEIKTVFNDDNSEKIVVFPTGGGTNNSVNISISNNTEITHASLNLSSEPNNGEYPSNVFLDVGRDGDYEWAFNGPGYGSMGYQSIFKNSQESISKQFSGTPGESISSKIQLPKNAEINSAQLNISGSFYEYIETSKISSTIGQVYNCEVGDIDGDNDLDVIVTYRSQTSPYPTELSWFKNTLGDGSSWTLHNIANTGLGSTYGLAVGDLDGDDDLDIVISDNTWNSRDILWYNNTNGLGTSWTVHTVRSSIPGTSVWIYNLALGDMNNDSYLDVVGTLSNSDSNQEDVYWYSNVNGDGRTWSQKNINKTIIGARGIYIGDIDGDGDNDTAVTVIPTSGTDQIFWFSNDNGVGTSWTRYLINDTLSDPFSVVIADIDNDNNPDLAIVGGSNTVWFEAPDDPTIVSNWKLHNIGVGGSLGGDIAVADIGYNNVNNEPDNNLDIIIAGRWNNVVIIFKNDGTPLNGGWETVYLNANHASANWMTMGDLDGDGYNDTLVASSLWNTVDDLIWYKLNGGAPTNVKLNLGFDAQADWVEPGLLDTTISIPDFTLNLTQYINQGMPFEDEYGNEFVSIPIKVTSETPGSITIKQLNIEYNYTVEVDTKSQGNLATELTEALKTTTPDEDGNCTIPFSFTSGSAGKLKLTDLVIEYNIFPWFSKPFPLELGLPEDTRDLALLDLSEYVDDDYLEPTELGFNISHITGPGADKVNVGIYNGYYLGADAKSGSANDNWTGFIEFIIEVNDNFGSTIMTDPIHLRITPVNDEPITGPAKYPNLFLAEGQLSKPLDLDSKDYFMDPDEDHLYFSVVVDPENTIDGENISVILDSNTNKVTFKGMGDWFGSNVPVVVYCDDSKPVNLTISQNFRISVLNINDPPVWSEIADIILQEDTKAMDYLFLDDYVHDIDNSVDNLTFSLISNSNTESVTVSINKNDYLDIYAIKAEFAGSTDVILRVTDPGGNFSDTSFKITYERINDPPSVKILTPINNSIIPSDSVIISWDVQDVDTPLENLTFTIYFGEVSPPPELTTGITANHYIVSELDEKTVYYCRIKANDGEEISFSETNLFMINSSSKPATSLISPKPDEILSEVDVEFEWSIINQNDLDLTYDFYLTTDLDSILSDGLKASGLGNTKLKVEGLEPDKTYYWTVLPRFDSGFGICLDSTREFSIDTTRTLYGIELNPNTIELRVPKGDKDLIEFTLKNIGFNKEKIILEISPRSIENNIDKGTLPTMISIEPNDSDFEFRFVLDTSNILPGKYQIIINATSIDTPASDQLIVDLEIYKPKEDTKGTGELFQDLTSLIPILLIIIIGIIGAGFIVRYKPEGEDEETFEEALQKGLKRDLELPKTDVLYKPPLDSEPGAWPGQAQTSGVPPLPVIGPSGTAATTGPGAFPQLPPGELDTVSTAAYLETQAFGEDTTLPPELGLGPEEALEPVDEGPKVLLPDEIDELKELDQIEPGEPGLDLDQDTIPEVDLPEPVPSEEPLSDDASETTGPQFGAPLELESIDSSEPSTKTDKSIEKDDSESSSKKTEDKSSGDNEAT